MKIHFIKPFEIVNLRQIYDERLPSYDKALTEALKAIAEIKHKHQKKATLRIAYVDGRVKRYTSIINKACEKNILAKDVFETIDDIVGLRVVVNNLKDIAPLIEELKAHQRFRIIEAEEHTGTEQYRAVHLKGSYRLTVDDQDLEVKCEIQIRTLLQDGWAILTHHDLYKNQAALPELAKPISKHLSDALNTLDLLANDLRQCLEENVEPPNELTEEATLDKQGIAFLYYELLGEKPQEYEVEFLVKKADELRVKTVGEARKGLSKEVINRLKEIHDSRFPELSPGSDFLEFGMLFAVKGPSAFLDYKSSIEAEWNEIESIGRAEALSAMPESFDEFVKMADRSDIPWHALKELGGVRECKICGTEILVPDAAQEAVLDHYGFPDTEVDLAALFFYASEESDCPYEQESVNTLGLCPFCDSMISKDD